MDDRIPPFLTVEEASRLLKIGRTKAYDLTREWRATGGRSGLPVIDLGDVLRVPGLAIEQMLGTGLGTPPPKTGKPTGSRVEPSPPVPAASPIAPAPGEAERAQPVEPPAVAAPTASPSVQPTRTRRSRREPTDQLPLFQPLTPTSPTTQSQSPDGPELTTHP